MESYYKKFSVQSEKSAVIDTHLSFSQGKIRELLDRIYFREFSLKINTMTFHLHLVLFSGFLVIPFSSVRLMDTLDDPEDEMRFGCGKLTASKDNSSSDWIPLAPLREGRWILPIYVKVADPQYTKFSLEFADTTDEDARAIAIFSHNVVEVLTVAEPSEVVDDERYTSGLVKNLLGTGDEVGFWIKIKNKEDTTILGVYEAGADTRDPLTSVEGNGISGNKWRLIVEYGTVTIKWNCRVQLGGKCSFPEECVEEGSDCIGQGPRVAVCQCSGYYENDGTKCKDGGRRHGDSCTTQKQCWKMQGQCRTTNNGEQKICSCKPGSKLDNYGVCGEGPDNVASTIDLDKMFRVPRYHDKNPGKRHVLDNSTHREQLPFNNRAGSFKPHCALGKVLGNSESMREEWPIRWKPEGFVLTGYWRQSDEKPANIKITFFSGGHLEDTENILSINLGQNITIDEKGNPTVRKDGLTANKGRGSSAWFNIEYSCQLGTLGCQLKIREGGSDGEMVEHSHLPNYQHLANPQGPGIAVFTVEAQEEAQLELAMDCVGETGSECHHNSECVSSACAVDKSVCQ